MENTLQKLQNLRRRCRCRHVLHRSGVIGKGNFLNVLHIYKHQQTCLFTHAIHNCSPQICFHSGTGNRYDTSQLKSQSAPTRFSHPKKTSTLLLFLVRLLLGVWFGAFIQETDMTHQTRNWVSLHVLIFFMLHNQGKDQHASHKTTVSSHKTTVWCDAGQTITPIGIEDWWRIMLEYNILTQNRHSSIKQTWIGARVVYDVIVKTNHRVFTIKARTRAAAHL